MKNFVTLLLLFGLIATYLPVHATAVTTQQSERLSPPLDHNVLMRLLHIVKKEFHMSMNTARDLYEAGEITITLVNQNGTDYYMLGYDGYCILVALEDNF